MKILDLYCGAGGASEGLHRAFPGAEIHGIDIVPQPNYPFTFLRMDAIDYLYKLWDDTDQPVYDFIWASPPCQNYSWAAAKHRNLGKEYPDLIAPTREGLMKLGIPYCIENVIGAPLIDPITLCGQTFGLKVYRHRLFETSFFVVPPIHEKHREKIHVGGEFVTVAGHGGDGSARFAKWQKAMDIDWMTKAEMIQSIPPAYSEYIAKQFILQKDLLFHAVEVVFQDYYARNNRFAKDHIQGAEAT